MKNYKIWWKNAGMFSEEQAKEYFQKIMKNWNNPEWVKKHKEQMNKMWEEIAERNL